jgi:peptidoglycan glycosyltransferase
VVVLNYKTGEILAMVSKPDYDPAALTTRQSGADETGSGYLNRVLQGQYPPGSTFKIVTLAATLENLPGAADRTYVCEGTRAFGNGKVTCYGGAVHGEMSLLEAFEKSCNITFASLAVEMGGDKLVAAARKMGFDTNFSFRDLVLYESSIPDAIGDVSELAWTGVGQGKLLVTPLHMALIVSAVANDGVMPTPQLIKQVTGVGGLPRLRTASGAYGRVMTSSQADFIGGTWRGWSRRAPPPRPPSRATRVRKDRLRRDQRRQARPHGCLVRRYLDDPAHPYAVAVVVEKGGSGGETAAPLAAKALKKAIARNITG